MVQVPDGDGIKAEKKKKPVGYWKKRNLMRNEPKFKYLDLEQFDMRIPAFPENQIEEEKNCGFFNWTFTLFNKQIHGKKRVEEQQKEAEQQQQDGSEPEPEKKTKVKAKGKPRNYNNSKLWLKRMRELSKRAGYVLQLKGCPVDNNVKKWKTIVVIKTNWKKRELGDCKKIRSRGIIATNKDPAKTIRIFGPLAFKTPRTIYIRIYVLRVKASKIPFINFDKKADENVCLCVRDEHIYVNRAALAMHSVRFRELINSGKGSDARNAIQIPYEFTPSLVRLALQSILLPARIDCLSVRELLKFGREYKLATLLAILEDSLIYRRRCKHFSYNEKVKLACEFGLDELLNKFVEKLKTPGRIRGKLKDNGLERDVKERLGRKLDAMEKELAQIREKKRQKREERKNKKPEKKKCNRKAKEALRNMERIKALKIKS